MKTRRLDKERTKLWDYIHERPSAQDARHWLEQLQMERIVVEDQPLEVETGPGKNFCGTPYSAEDFWMMCLNVLKIRNLRTNS